MNKLFIILPLLLIITHCSYNPWLAKRFAYATGASYYPADQIKQWNCNACNLFELENVKTYKFRSIPLQGVLWIFLGLPAFGKNKMLWSWRLEELLIFKIGLQIWPLMKLIIQAVVAVEYMKDFMMLTKLWVAMSENKSKPWLLCIEAVQSMLLVSLLEGLSPRWPLLT